MEPSAPTQIVREYENECQLSARTGIPVKTLQKWRANGDGPPWSRWGGTTVRYRIAEVNDWAEARQGMADRRVELRKRTACRAEGHMSDDLKAAATVAALRKGAKSAEAIDLPESVFHLRNHGKEPGLPRAVAAAKENGSTVEAAEPPKDINASTEPNEQKGEGDDR